ncbi:unnamed protein product [Cuscuta epithymum]|uniref:Uncharacterized protein n=2 Tax=Cuscuta epithymum TaxID=186058 RepID=A0AAV0ES98_9ASTE|nr:unnamed protein product [Cuscuta epithymum]
MYDLKPGKAGSFPLKLLWVRLKLPPHLMSLARALGINCTKRFLA